MQTNGLNDAWRGEWERAGMAWWNGLTVRERELVMERTSKARGKLDVSAAECWLQFGDHNFRPIGVLAKDDHVIEPYDSIDQRCLSHRGWVMAPELACNVPGAVGKLALEFNAAGRQVWAATWKRVINGKIIREVAL